MAKKAGRIYWRNQGRDGKRRAYADFREDAYEPAGAMAASDLTTPSPAPSP